MYIGLIPSRLISITFPPLLFDSIIFSLISWDGLCGSLTDTTRSAFLSATSPSKLFLTVFQLVPQALLASFHDLNPYCSYSRSTSLEKDQFSGPSLGLFIIEASNPVPTPLLGHRCRSSQEITGSPTPFSTSNHYLWICASASFSLSNPNIAA